MQLLIHVYLEMISNYLKFINKDKLMSFSIILVFLQVFLAIFAPLLGFKDPYQMVIIERLKGPNLLNFFGTDHLGRDVLSRVVYGYRTSLLTSSLSVIISLIVGGTIGLLAAFYRGLFDRIIMRFMDVLFAFPILLLAIGIIAVIGPSIWGAAIAIAVVYTPIFARLIRGPALVICETEYVESAQAIGASDLRIIFNHILPNLISVISSSVKLVIICCYISRGITIFFRFRRTTPYSFIRALIIRRSKFSTLISLACNLFRSSNCFFIFWF